MRNRYFGVSLIMLPLAFAGCGSSQPTPTEAAVISTPAPVTLSAPTIAPDLATMARKVRDAPSAGAAAAFSTPTIRVNDQRQIQVYIYVKQLASGVKQSIAEAGATDIRSSRPLGLYQYRAWATPAALAKIAALSDVYKVAPPTFLSPPGQTAN